MAKKSLGDVKLRYRINDGAVKTVTDRAVHRAASASTRSRASTTTASAARSPGPAPGDEVEVWFEGGRKSSSHFTYTARSETGTRC